jgi:prepilin signal peptidase PulO-like enzyme (type II secretory pathway)
LTMPYSQKGFRTMIPFGPFLAFGGLLYSLGGRWMADLYNQFIFPFLF